MRQWDGKKTLNQDTNNDGALVIAGDFDGDGVITVDEVLAVIGGWTG